MHSKFHNIFCFIEYYTYSIVKFIILLATFILIIYITCRFLADIITTLLRFLRFLRYVKNHKYDKDVDIITGPWGSGKTYYFKNEYIRKYKYIDVCEVSCFSYNRNELIEQILSTRLFVRWLYLNPLLYKWTLLNWQRSLPKNKLIFIDDIDRLPNNNDLAKDFLGIIDKLKNNNKIVLCCSLNNIDNHIILNYMEKIIDNFPIEINRHFQIQRNSIHNSLSKLTSKLEPEIKTSFEKILESIKNSDKNNNKNIENFLMFFSNDSETTVNIRSIEIVMSFIIRLQCPQKSKQVLEFINSCIREMDKSISYENIKKYSNLLKYKNYFIAIIKSKYLLLKYPTFPHDISKIIKGNNKTHDLSDKDFPDYVCENDISDIKDIISKSNIALLNNYFDISNLTSMFEKQINDLNKDFEHMKNITKQEFRCHILFQIDQLEKYFIDAPSDGFTRDALSKLSFQAHNYYILDNDDYINKITYQQQFNVYRFMYDSDFSYFSKVKYFWDCLTDNEDLDKLIGFCLDKDNYKVIKLSNEDLLRDKDKIKFYNRFYLDINVSPPDQDTIKQLKDKISKLVNTYGFHDVETEQTIDYYFKQNKDQLDILNDIKDDFIQLFKQKKL